MNSIAFIDTEIDPKSGKILATDDARQQLYVAMTRAKQNLTIHLNSKFLDSLSAENLVQVEDRKIICHQRS